MQAMFGLVALDGGGLVIPQLAFDECPQFLNTPDKVIAIDHGVRNSAVSLRGADVPRGPRCAWLSVLGEVRCQLREWPLTAEQRSHPQVPDQLGTHAVVDPSTGPA